ncbi:MAG: sugar kinase [Gemmatimonadota bacterium]|nr:sugar kinase [Gemmatimonadota bacterium]
MKRVVTFGEIMLRLSPPGQERFFQSPQLRTFFGGSEANTAASLAHFGVRSEFVSRVPSNAIGDAALAALRAEGVDVRGVVRGGERLGIYFVESGADLRDLRVVYDRAGSAFSQLAPGALDWKELLSGADWFHVSGITPALGEGPAASAREAIEAARALDVRVSIDLNYRPALWGGRNPRATMQPLVQGCDVLIGNPGAVAAMLGITTAGTGPEPPEALRETAARLHAELGCGQVALTRREVLSASEHGWSAVLYDGATGALHVSRRYQVRLVDRVGGGDSFAAGLIHALLDGRTAESALEFATAASALKLTIPGDFNRISADEAERLLGLPDAPSSRSQISP